MNRPTSPNAGPQRFRIASRPGYPSGAPVKIARGALEFLQANDKLATLLPTLTKMAALQKDCTASLPDMFSACEVLQLVGGQLVLSVPNAALAARLKQKIPNLQETLAKRGWQVSAIRLKVQVGRNVVVVVPVKQLVLPQTAVSAMAELETALPDEPRNGPLKAALAALVSRHRTGP